MAEKRLVVLELDVIEAEALHEAVEHRLECEWLFADCQLPRDQSEALVRLGYQLERAQGDFEG